MRNELGKALTERQRECLLLVYSHHTIAEIAGKLGLSIEGVNYHLGGARRTLGASSSAQAARMVHGENSPTHYISHVATQNAVALARQSETLASSTDDPTTPPVMREERATFDALSSDFDLHVSSSHMEKPGEKRKSLLIVANSVIEATNRIFGWLFVAGAVAFVISKLAHWYEVTHHIRPR